MKNQTTKELVSEFLAFLKYKVDNDILSMGDVKALANAIMNQIPVLGTVEEIAGFYGRTQDAVRHVISGSVFDRPRRRVHYSFGKVSARIPQSWYKSKNC